VRTYHAAAVRPASATLVAVGDCEHAEIVRLADAAFAGWDGPAVAHGGDVPVPIADPPRLNVVPRPGAPQSELRIGHIGVARHTPDYHALVVGNMVLGGQFVSRLNLNLRERRGLTYGVRSAFDFRRLAGPFSVQVSVQTRATAEAIAETISEIAAIRGPQPVTREELSMGSAAITRGYARNFETAEQVARAAIQLALYDLPDDYFAEFVPRIERVTVDEVTQGMARHTEPGRLGVLIVGDLQAIHADLPALNLGEPVVLSSDTF